VIPFELRLESVLQVPLLRHHRLALVFQIEQLAVPLVMQLVIQDQQLVVVQLEQVLLVVVQLVQVQPLQVLLVV
jgi:hypothetical protein